MNEYYFTFGQQHYTTEGVEMKDHYIKVIAETGDKARGLFITHFMSKHMEAPDKFSLQYEAEEFDVIKHLYPRGEYMVLKPL